MSDGASGFGVGPRAAASYRGPRWTWTSVNGFRPTWSPEIEVGVVAARQPAIPGPPIEERSRPPPRPQPRAKRGGCGRVDLERRAVDHPDDHPVLFSGGARAHLALQHVEPDEIGLALERISPSAAA